MSDHVEAMIHLVRHAIARGRSSWAESDALRPLTAHGLAQAEAIGERLASGGAITAVRTSPARRCIETVAPTARRLALALEETEHLAEGSDPDESLRRLIAEASAPGVAQAIVACTHGDVIDGVLGALIESKIEIDGPLIAPKGSTWQLVLRDGRLARARYVAPPP
jgi:8-oxo-dGTP diphosphatase